VLGAPRWASALRGSLHGSVLAIGLCTLLLARAARTPAEHL
jgi:hypothetical protein